MTNEGRRDKESCAGDHRKRTETPTLASFRGLRDLSTALAYEAKRSSSGSCSAFGCSLWPQAFSIDSHMTCSLCGDVCGCSQAVVQSGSGLSLGSDAEPGVARCHVDELPRLADPNISTQQQVQSQPIDPDIPRPKFVLNGVQQSAVA